MNITSADYNTQQEDIILREYGRNIQKMAKVVQQESDQEKKLAMATTLVHLMKQINPNLKDSNQDVNQKVWSHLHIISDYKLELENPPFPVPEPTMRIKKPNPVDYHDSRIAFRHYGKNIEFLIEKSKDIEDEEERESAIIHIGRLMKRFFQTWNKDAVDDSLIIGQLDRLSNGKLTIDLEKVREHKLFESNIKDNKQNGNTFQNNPKKKKKKTKYN